MNNLVNLFDETKIFIYENCRCCGNIDFISKSLKLNKCWEPNITFVILNLLKNKNNNIFFDIGCNIGYYSLLSTKYCEKIYAFDANIKNINLLQKSITINNINNIIPTVCAITDDENKLFKTGTLHEHNVGSLQVEQVYTPNHSNIKSLKLDNFINTNNIDNIDILKIDIEGSELDCLKGLDQTLNTNIIKNIIIEVTPLWNVQIAKNILNYLKLKNYILFDIGLNEVGTYNDIKIQNLFNNEINNIDNFVININIQTNILAKKII